MIIQSTVVALAVLLAPILEAQHRSTSLMWT
jgi:hypothetical protein